MLICSSSPCAGLRISRAGNDDGDVEDGNIINIGDMEDGDAADAYFQISADFGMMGSIAQAHMNANDADEEAAFREEMMQHLASVEEAELEERDQAQQEALQEGQRSRWRQTQLSWAQRVVQSRLRQQDETEVIQLVGGAVGNRSTASGRGIVVVASDSSDNVADASEGTVCRWAIRTSPSPQARKPFAQRFWSVLSARAKA